MPLETFFTVSEQVRFFLLSVVLGAVMGVWYDVFRTIRILVPFARKPLPTAVCDVIFWVSCCFALFLFSYTVSGAVLRGFMVIGSLCGFVLYLMSVGSIVTGFFRLIAKGLMKIGTWCQKRSALFVRNGKNTRHTKKL